MSVIKNPAKSRPLSANVRRLMTRAREAPLNPDVQKIERIFSARDLAYCDMQGNIFMAAIDRALGMDEFAPLYMNSQLASIIDYSFSCAGGLETDDLVNLLQVPLLVKSPDVIVDVVLWLNNVVCNLSADESANMVVMQACITDSARSYIKPPEMGRLLISSIDAMADEYEYAYWLGYIYRFECLLHDESSRMVYGAFDEAFMKKTYDHMQSSSTGSEALSVCAGEICRRLDMLLVGQLWK